MLERQKGQGLVEFALVLPVLLLVILAIIETALIFQGYLAVQHAAREAARWAITYQPTKEPGESDEEYLARRVRLIKQVAVDRATGLRIDEEHLGLDWVDWQAYHTMPGFFGVEVWGFPSFSEPAGGWKDEDLRDHPGLPGLPMRVRVTHNVELLDPIVRALVPQVRVVGQAEMINEGAEVGLVNPPRWPPPSTPAPIFTRPPALPGPSDVAGTAGVPVPTPDVLLTLPPTPSATAKPTPTATPAGPFITSSQYDVRPEDLILINVNQHPLDPSSAYQLWLVDGNFTLAETISPTVIVDEHGSRLGVPYTLSSNVSPGNYYLETHWPGASPPDPDYVARSLPIQVRPPPPDLTVNRIVVESAPIPNTEIMISVQVENRADVSVESYFDVDLFVNPPEAPLPQRPGTSKVWLNGLGPQATTVVTHVVVLPGGSAHELWARIDGSEWVEESDEDNNLVGPIELAAVVDVCSDLVDYFDGDGLDAKWTALTIGDASRFNQRVEEDGTLTLEGNGDGIWDASDAGLGFVYQTFAGDFVATLKINAGPDNHEWAKIGLMVRDSTAADSPRVMALKTRDHGLQFGFRPSTGADSDRFAGDVQNNRLPVWVRLVRLENTFAAYYSHDGINWTQASGQGDGTIGPGDGARFSDTVLVGVAVTSYGDAVGTGNVDDFQVCPGSDLAAGNCQAHSDDFDDPAITDWQEADIGPVQPGTSEASDQVLTVWGSGAAIWGSADNSHYTYKEVEGDFVVTLKINQGPDAVEYAKGGLMVRGNLQPDSAAVLAMHTYQHGLQFAARQAEGQDMVKLGEYTPVDLPAWVRIIRSGNTWTLLYSQDGQNWQVPSGPPYGSVQVAMPDSVLVGMAVSSYDATQLDDAEFDDFALCSASSLVGKSAPPAEEKPPGSKACTQMIASGGFEASESASPWEKNEDVAREPGQAHSGNFSLRFPAGKRTVFPYDVLEPWAQQTVSVPDDLTGETELIFTYWYWVEPQAAPDPDDGLYLTVLDEHGEPKATDILLVRGNEQVPGFQERAIDLKQYFDVTAYQGEALQLYFYGAHDADDQGSWFYLDDVALTLCTTQPIPKEKPGTASLGGTIQVIIDGIPTRLPGVWVWASAPPTSNYQTRSIHDGTYHFYNLEPGTYTLYAEVWVGESLYTGTTEVNVLADERNDMIDLILIE